MQHHQEGIVTLNRWLAVGGMAASLMFLPIVFLVGEARTGYSHVSEHVSALSEPGAPGAWAQTGNFILFGVLIAALAVGLHREINGGQGSVLGPVLVAIGGLVAGLGSAFFPEEPVRGHLTAVGVMHATTAIVGFVALATAMLFAMPRRLNEDPRWTSLTGLSLWFGVAASVLFFSFPLAVWGIVDSLQPRSGLIQRVFLAVVLLWLFLLSVRLFQTSPVKGPAGQPSRDGEGALPGARDAPLGDLEVA